MPALSARVAHTLPLGADIAYHSRPLAEHVRQHEDEAKGRRRGYAQQQLNLTLGQYKRHDGDDDPDATPDGDPARHASTAPLLLGYALGARGPGDCRGRGRPAWRSGRHPLVAIIDIPLARALLRHPYLAVLVGHPQGTEALAILLIANAASRAQLLEAPELMFCFVKVHDASPPIRPSRRP